MDFFTKVILRIVVFWYLLCIGILITPHIKMIIGKYYYFSNSYISKINAPTYLEKNIKLTLDIFNKMCDTIVISYSKGENLDRDIEITEVDSFIFYPNTIGRAWVAKDNCKIELKKNMDNEQFRLTLLHEYLHCMGYGHVNVSNGDLMSPYSGKVTEQNIEEYAKDLCRVIRWSRNLKN